jgi:glycosyltransferase involved in cell wall biosynthesis
MKIFYVAAFADQGDASWFSLGRMRKVQQVATALISLEHKPEFLNIAPLRIKSINLCGTVLPVKRLCTVSFLPLRFLQLFYNSARFFYSAYGQSSNAVVWLYNTRLAESIVAFVALLIRPQLSLVLQLEDLPSARSANDGLRGRLDRWCTAWMSRRADCVFAVSEQVARAYSFLVKVPTEAITNLPPTLDPLFLQLAQGRKQPFSSSSAQIFYAGSFSKEKGVDDLIEAFLAIRSPSCKLLLAGSAPESLVQAHRLNNSIHFLGIVSNLELFRLYTSVDVVVNPHKPILNPDHVFPFKLIETVASGALPLTTPVPGAEDLGLPAECFFHDAESLASKLNHAPDLWKSRRSTIESASQACRSKYSFDAAKESLARGLSEISSCA